MRSPVQYPKVNWRLWDKVWYENRPLGSKQAVNDDEKHQLRGRSLRYLPNHSVRATAINLWANSGLTNREIMAISGHRNESNVQSYHSIPSVKQLRICSEVLCTALGYDGKVDEQPANVMISMTPLQQLPFSSVNTAISATHQNTAPFSQMFTSCTIGNIHIFIHQP